MAESSPQPVVVVTGAAKGIGQDIAYDLAAHGWRVAVFDNDEDALKATVTAPEAEGIRGWSVDIADYGAVEAAVDEIERTLGPIHALVNNALWVEAQWFLETSEESFRRTLDSSLVGYFICSQTVARRMVERRYGRIVNISSGSAEKGFPRTLAYACAKGGVNAFTRVIAVELAQHEILVNTLTLGPILTETGKRIVKSREGANARLQRVPLGRFGEAKDYVGAVRYLISPDLSWMTGSALYVDGGSNSAALVLSVKE